MRNEDKIRELVRQADCRTDWKKRLKAVVSIAKIPCKERRTVLIHLALYDKTYPVKHRAFLECQRLGLKYKGKPIYLGKKNIGYSTAVIMQRLTKVKRESHLEVYDPRIFKTIFKQLDPEMYDVLSCYKGGRFDQYLESQFYLLSTEDKKKYMKNYNILDYY